MSERLFTEQQVADIIRRAAEAQSSTRPNEATHGSISASEIRRIGAELGIDPNAIEAAMSKAVTWTAHDTGSVYSLKRTYERRIYGAISETDYVVVMESFPLVGIGWSNPEGESNSRIYAYTTMVGFSQSAVTITKSEESSSVRFMSSVSGVSYYPILVGGWLFFTISVIDVVTPLDPITPLGWVYFAMEFVLIAVATVFSVLFLVRLSNWKTARKMDEVAASLSQRILEREPARVVTPDLHTQGQLPMEEEPRLDQTITRG